MSKEAYVVIGANYGDEGKGLMTDYLASQFGKDCCVVKFNGTAQAGHTVCTPDGKRHVFSHFGSGTFVGAATHLSKRFFVHPIKYRSESIELAAKVPFPPIIITCDRNCNVITPYDMYLNDLSEANRANKHGSTGFGFYEAVTRCARESLVASDLIERDMLRLRLSEIRRRAMLVAQKRFDHDFSKEDVFGDDVFERFIEDCEFFVGTLSEMTDGQPTSIASHGNYIFEGGQGLLLDEKFGMMPHCTPSNCGLENVIEYLRVNGVSDEYRLNVVYVTRSYLTRHGEGPLHLETDLKLTDLTNHENHYQGKFRYGLLSAETMLSHASKDFEKHSRPGDSAYVAITHLDEYTDAVANLIAKSARYCSYGATREDVVDALV